MTSNQTPRARVEAECARRGKDAVVAGCIRLLAGRPTDPDLVVVLGGRPAEWAKDPELVAGPDYWLRVWAARGLLWAWDGSAGPSVQAALSDPAWRVREMACKVVARNLVGDALAQVVALRDDDPVQRVRSAASRAAVHLTAAGA